MINMERFVTDVKVSSPVNFLNYILDVYASSGEVVFNSNNGKDLRELFRKDETSAGEVNLTDKNNLIAKRLMIDYMKAIGEYDSYVKETNQEEKAKKYLEVSNAVKREIAKFGGYLTFDSSALFKGTPQMGGEHELSINVDAQNLFFVIRNIYETARANNIDFFMTVPNRSKEAKGINDGILLICNTENLEATLKLFDLLPDNVKKMCKTPCSFGSVIDGWVGYTSIDGEQKEEMTVIVGEALITSVDKCLFAQSQSVPELVSYVEALMSDDVKNKDKVRIEALNILKGINEDAYRAIVMETMDELERHNVMVDYLFLSKDVEASIAETYGVNIIPKEAPIVEEIVDETPLVEEQDSVDELLSQLNGAVIEEVPAETPVQEEIVEEVEEKIEVSQEDQYVDVPVSDTTFISMAPIVQEEVIVEEEVQEPLTDEERNFLFEDAILSDVKDASVLVEEPVLEADPANRVKYNEIGLTDDKLDTLVINDKGKTVTLYQYLEENQTLFKIPVNSQVVLATDVGSKDSGSVISGATFITDTIVEYITKLGEKSVDELISRYALDIKEEEIKKKGFFGGLFGKK